MGHLYGDSFRPAMFVLGRQSQARTWLSSLSLAIHKPKACRREVTHGPQREHFWKPQPVDRRHRPDPQTAHCSEHRTSGDHVGAVGSHDTASAVAAVPAAAPNFTNERGVDGTTRYLRNVGGLWLLSESMRTWEQDALQGNKHDAGTPASSDSLATLSLPGLLAAAAAELTGGPLIDVDSEDFIAPGNMPERIRAAVSATGGTLATRPAAVVRCIMDSLAAAYATTVAQAQELSGKTVDVIHIVGGGSQNELLCQLTANATGLPVVAGPVEATALGNVLIQARAAGAAPRSLQDLRAIVAASLPGKNYQPQL